MQRLLSVFGLIVFFNALVAACSIGRTPDPPIAAPSRNLYIFIGEVIGYTEPVEYDKDKSTVAGTRKFYGQGRGLKIKPLEIINMPVSTNDYVELFKFGVTSFCAPELTDAYYPIGTKVRVTTGETTLLRNRKSENRVRLESTFFDSVSDIRESDEFRASADSMFDYKTWKSLQEKIPAERRRAFSDFMFIEINKDLLRLEKAATKQERYAILERLLYAPSIDFPRIVNPALGALQTIKINKYERLPSIQTRKKLTSTEKRLLVKREEIEKSGYFNFQPEGFFINKK